MGAPGGHGAGDLIAVARLTNAGILGPGLHVTDDVAISLALP